MRSIRPTAIRHLRAPPTSEPVVSPLRSRQAPSPCLFCIDRPSWDMNARRHQSSSTTSNTRREEPFSSSRSTSANPQTHYSFFPSSLPDGPPPSGHFKIDLGALRREFLQLQARAHPDMHSAENKKKAEATSSRINEAYKTLQNPLRRAQYLLQLRGIDVAEDERLKVEDPELLMEVLETREAIEEAEKEEDLAQMKKDNDARIEASEKVLEGAFLKDDIDAAMGEAVRLRYWVNIKDSLDGWERGKPVVIEH